MTRRTTNAAPSRARLIHLLIEERAKVISHQRQPDNGPSMWNITDTDRDQARREIEREVLKPQTKGKS